MYPNLSYFFHDLFGTEPDNFLSVINTFGFFLALAFLAAGYVLYLEFTRMEKAGILTFQTREIILGEKPRTTDIAWNGVLGFILGYKLVFLFQHFREVEGDVASIIFSGQGNWGAGILIGIVFAAYRYWDVNRHALPKPEKKSIKIYPHDMVGDIAITAAISGIIGAKVFALFEGPNAFSNFIRDPLGQLFSGAGLAIYGGLIVAFAVVLWYVRRRGLPVIRVMDAAAPAMIMGYAVGRLGCQFAGDGDWGIANTAAKPGWFFLPDWAWAYDYPRNVLNEGIPIDGCIGHYCSHLTTPVFPTPLYEVVASLVIFGILWALRKRLTIIPGMIFFIYCILNGIERFFIEKIRVNETMHVMGMDASQAEIISTIVFLVGVTGAVVLWQHHRAKAA